MNVRTIETVTHGRYLVDSPPPGTAPLGLLVGFHGYSENAAVQLERLKALPGADAWVRVSVQALNRFYRGNHTPEIAASWMTAEDRELTIGDNIAYVAATVDAVAAAWPSPASLVFAGFSQGVSMAFRAACAATRAVSSVIALGGDVPPELSPEMLGRIPRVLYGRGDRDPYYSLDQFAADQARLRAARVDVTAYRFDDEHVWTSGFSDAAGYFLHRLDSQSR